MSPRPGERGTPRAISHFKLDRLLGSGGMGAVYLATDRRDGSPVAVKLLHEHLGGSASFRARFEQEAHFAALLRSPYTVHILDYGVERGRCFIVMEYVQGRTLKDVLDDGPLPPDRAIRIAIQVARALEEAAARRVVHRDVKPGNVLLRGSDSVKVTDFGIARHADTAALTAPGEFVGTPAYAAPEQLAGWADHRTDIFALGATLHHMLAGAPPQVAGDAPTQSAELLPSAAIPLELRAVIDRCLQSVPDERYQTATDLAAALTSVTTARAGVGSAAATAEFVTPPAWQPISLRLTLRRSRLPFAQRFRRSRYDLSMRNEGDDVVEAQLAADDDGVGMRIEIPDHASVLPRATTVVPVRVGPRRRRWRGATETRLFTLSASPAGGQPPAAVSGQYIDQPYSWLPAIGAAAISSVAAAAFALATVAGAFAGEEKTKPLRIGVIMPTSGAFPEEGTELLNGARLAVNEINANGGVLGHPVELVPADSVGNPDTAVAEARRLMDQVGVQAIVTEEWDHLALAVTDGATSPASVLHVSLGPPFALDSERDDLWFRPVASMVTTRAALVAELVVRRGYRKVCSVYMSEKYDSFERMHQAFVSGATAAGVEVIGVLHDSFLRSVGSGIADRCQGVDALVFLVWSFTEDVEGPDPTGVLREAFATGAEVIVLDDLQKDEVMERVGWDAASGVRGVNMGLPNETHRERLVHDYQRLFGGLGEKDRGAFTIAYDAVYLIALAAEAAGTTDPEAMGESFVAIASEPGSTIKPGPGETGFQLAKEILSDGREIDYDGASGPIELDVNGDNTRTIATFWHVDASRRLFVRDARFLFDVEAGTFAELPCVDAYVPVPDFCTGGTPPEDSPP